jgi:hypothetical protein
LVVRLITLSAFSGVEISVVGDVVANDVDSDNSKLSYRIGGADKEHFEDTKTGNHNP